MAFLEIRNLNKSFGDVEVLKGINLSIEKNEIVCLLGGSGNGKTTLLRCLCGLEQPTSGEIIINGEIKNQGTSKNVGYVFQSFNLFPQYTAVQNVTLALDCRAKGKNRKEDKAKNIALAKELLTKVGLEDKFDSYPYQLSGGQKQRVAIARALALKPEVLLFDEPTSALDPKTTKDIANQIVELKKENTIIIVTHDMDFAKLVADKAYIVQNGIIEQGGTLDELLSNDDGKLDEYLGGKGE